MRIFETKISSLNKLFSALLNYADTFSFVRRDDVKSNLRFEKLLTDLSIYLFERKVVTEWPGTRLLIDEAELFVFHFNAETAFILSNYNDDLFCWEHPDLPEDLVFYKNEQPIFISITHEKDAYFQLDAEGEDYFRKHNMIS